MADGSQRDKLVNEHLNLARKLAHQFHARARSMEYHELESFAVEGLLLAADRYDASAGTAFSTFAYYRIRGALYDGLRKTGRLSRTEYQKVQARRAADEYLESCADQETATRGVGAATHDEDELRAIFEAARSVTTIHVISLNSELADESGMRDTAPLADEALARARLARKLQEAIAQLPERERHFIHKRYFEHKSLQAAGQELGLSRSWASRLHARAVDMLKQLLAEPVLT